MQPAEEIAKKLINNEWPNVSTWRINDAYVIIEQLIKTKSQEIKLPHARSICRRLNQYHHYDVTLKASDLWLDINGFDAEISRHKAQALINLNHLDQAEAWILGSIDKASLITPPIGLKELKELKGLVCRIKKQRYVIHREDEQLVEAINEYLALYDDIQYSDPCWHGVNVVALLSAAKRKSVSHPALSRLPNIIEDITKAALEIKEKNPNDIWSLATLAELYLAKGKDENAEYSLYKLFDHPELNPFVTGSLERQLKEIWDANAYLNEGNLASRMAAMIARNNDRVADFRQFSFEEINTLSVQANLSGGLEKNFGNERFFSVDSIKRLLEKCNSVGCVVTEDNWRVGTGFLVKGNILKKEWGEQLVFLTNCHVVSNDYPNALPADNAFVTFDLDSADKGDFVGKKYKFTEILFSSPPGNEGELLPKTENLDVSILRLDSIPKNAVGLTCANRLPIVDGSTKAFVIGHPNGSSLQVSLHDAQILDLDRENQRLLHYRTPTEPGNSGSPVFNANWEVIAIHHAGSSAMPKMKTKPPPEFYEANEGITIAAIIAALS